MAASSMTASVGTAGAGAEGVAEWSAPLIDGKPPPARGGQSGVLIGNLFIIIGGTFFKDKFQYLNDLWVVDTDSMEWHKPSAVGRPPSARYGHGCAVVGTSVYVFGGKGPSGAVHNDLHRLDVERWTWSLVPSTTAPPLGRFGHTLSAVGDKLVLFGGWDGSGCFNDLWVFDAAASSWIKPVVDGPAPAARHGHSMVLAPATGRLVVWGGWSVSGKGLPEYRSDGRELDTATMTWERLRVTGERPSGRYWHASGMVNDRYMLVAGGWGADEAAESAKEAEAAAASAGLPTGAAAVASRSAASSRAAASAASGPRRSRSLWLLDTERREWVQPLSAGRHLGLRYGQSAAVLGPFALLFGGWDGVKSRADVTQLDLSAVVGDVTGESTADGTDQAGAEAHGDEFTAQGGEYGDEDGGYAAEEGRRGGEHDDDGEDGGYPDHAGDDGLPDHTFEGAAAYA